MRVDLPAPFSPSSASASPRRAERLTPFSACAPPNALTMRSKRNSPATPIPPRPLFGRQWDRSADLSPTIGQDAFGSRQFLRALFAALGEPGLHDGDLGFLGLDDLFRHLA